jgi:MFS family permease
MIYLPMNLAFIIGPFSASFVARSFQVRDVFLFSAGFALIAFLIFVTTIRKTREVTNV